MKKFLIHSLIMLFVSYGYSNASSENIESPQEEQTPTSTPQPQNFAERVGLQLAFKGVECVGGEQVEIQEGDEIKTVTCERDQWQLTIDNANTCSDDGSCTEIYVYPFIGELIVLEESEEQSDYGFGALTQVNAETTQNILDYKVRFYNSKEPQVLLR